MGNYTSEYRGCHQRNDKSDAYTSAWPASVHHVIISGAIQSGCFLPPLRMNMAECFNAYFLFWMLVTGLCVTYFGSFVLDFYIY